MHSVRASTLAALAALASAGAILAQNQRFFSAPVAIDLQTPPGASDLSFTMNRDETTAVFASNRPGGRGGYDLWIVQRAQWSAAWNAPRPLQALNTPADEIAATLDASGREILFSSDRQGGTGRTRIYASTRPSTNVGFGAPVEVASVAVANEHVRDPMLTDDGLILFYASTETGGGDIYTVTRPAPGQPWGNKRRFAPASVPGAHDRSPMPDANGLLVWFASDRAGGQGGMDIWMVWSNTTASTWSAPMPIGELNSAADESHLFATAFSGTTYHSGSSGSARLIKCECENGGSTRTPDNPATGLEGSSYPNSNKPTNLQTESELAVGSTHTVSFYDWETTKPIVAYVVALGVPLAVPFQLASLDGLLEVLPVLTVTVTAAQGEPTGFPIPVPNDPGLSGAPVWLQGLGVRGSGGGSWLPVRKLVLR